MIRVAINGFGRIGRMVFRQAIKESAFEIVAINASYPSETLAHLIKYDTVHGKFDGTVEAFEDHLLVDDIHTHRHIGWASVRPGVVGNQGDGNVTGRGLWQFLV